MAKAGHGYDERVDRQHEACAAVLRTMGFTVHGMPSRTALDAFVQPETRAWLVQRAAAGRRDDLVMTPSIRSLGGWQRFLALIDAVGWAEISDEVPLNPYRYPYDPPAPQPSPWQRIADWASRTTGRPAVHSVALEAERARLAARHDDGQDADWLIGFVLDDIERPEPAGRGLKYCGIGAEWQMKDIQKEDAETHRPAGRHIGSITIPQYLLWQGMRRRAGRLPADRQGAKPFLGDRSTMIPVLWGTCFPYYPEGSYEVPSMGAYNERGRTDYYHVIGRHLPDGTVSVYPEEHSSHWSQGVRRVLRVSPIH
ncbi:hypothetical protein [Streptomyces canus]|uniref:hypothetical protein n=1 Tax=Streptomyces canus TaxID=58343 RepID=UPI000366D982|nr:hypothetical protein [Streptomyces canus]